MKSAILRVAALAAILFATAEAGRAGEAVDRMVLPIADPAFKGKIGSTFKESTPDFPLPVAAPEGAPNVLIIVLDDVGFGHAGAFGGAVETPTMDKLAREGLR